MGAFEVFAIVACAIALVFLSWALFRMTKFPPGTIFILLGIILSVFGSRMPQSLLDTVALAAPILLGSILFSCGLKMNLHGMVAYKRSIALSLLTVAITVLVVVIITHFFLGFDFKGAILAGAICAGVCSFFVFHIIDVVNLDEGVGDTLMLESSLTDAIVLMLSLAVFQLSNGASAIESLAFGTVFGLLAGIIWVRLMRFVADFPHRDALTLSLVLAVAALCEIIFQNSGMASAFFFGLAMGNANLLKTRARFEGLLRFQEDVLMAGGTFFFFYIGLMASEVGFGLVLTGAALWVIVLAIRSVAIMVSLEGQGFNIWIAGLAPKGLGAVLIAYFAMANGFPVAPKLFSIIVPLLVLSGLFAGICASVLEGKRPPRVETVANSRKWGAVEEGKIGHAYDIEEMKRTINGEESE
ncbi:MAG: cation:proton antiporter [Candidatus Micrarchaeota archaeon]